MIVMGSSLKATWQWFVEETLTLFRPWKHVVLHIRMWQGTDWNIKSHSPLALGQKCVKSHK